MRKTIIYTTAIILCVYSYVQFWEDDKFVRKKVSDESITVKWYYYSYISNLSPDYVEISTFWKEKILLEAKYAIVDVQLVGKSIVISLYKPEKGIIYTKQLPKTVYGYTVQYDTLEHHEGYQYIPIGRKLDD